MYVCMYVYMCVALPTASVSYYTALTAAVGSTDFVGLGYSNVTVNPGSSLLSLSVSYTNLQGSVTVAHIHCCTTTPGQGTTGPAIVT
jgi:hypothetical protein